GRRSGDAVWFEKLLQLLTEVMREDQVGLAAVISLLLFRHFDVVEPEEMCLLAGRGTGDEFRLLGQLGAALRESDSAALLDIAEARDRSLPDLAALCRSLARAAVDGEDARTDKRRDSGLKLTVRERQISNLIIAGRTNAEIAAEIGVRVRTVEGHTYRLYQKLGVTRREQVAEALGRTQATR
ncbi:MAG: helix-turn-helix transcriptional regulator, partial [Brevibacterium sp.]|nr:helix-turn-helix transcriptional regulator [Brevibacterium sp.]